MAEQVTTIGLVLDEFLNLLEKNLSSSVKFVYDEEMTLESSLTKLRAISERNGTTFDGEFPLFSFRRSVLKYLEDGQSRRSVVNRTSDQIVGDNSKLLIYKSINGEIEINFSYYSNSFMDNEIFEIDYLSEFSSSKDKSISVSLPDGLGEFKYYIKYEPLEDKLSNSEGIYHKRVNGTIKINGWFLTLKGSSSSIKTILAKINSINTKYNLSEMTITSH